MNGETPLQLLLDFYDRVLIVLARPVVQRPVEVKRFLLLSPRRGLCRFCSGACGVTGGAARR
ncbi:MAG: hypothetical protein R3A10_09440 [Caldilineaceae bacterium]